MVRSKYADAQQSLHPDCCGPAPGSGRKASMTDHEPWQLTGNAAELYERYLVPTITGVWAADLVRRAELQPGQRVIDVACGTGIVARLAAPWVGQHGRVVGLDRNPTMLAVARTLTPPDGALLTWVEASVLALPFPVATFDVVLCQLGLQFFPDRSRALRELKRVLRPRGRVLLSVFGPLAHNPAPQALIASLARHLGSPASAIKRAEHALADRAVLAALAVGADFAAVTIETTTQWVRFPSLQEYVRIQFAATPLATLVRVLPADQQVALADAVLAEMRDALRAFLGDAGFVFPQECHILVANAGGA